MIKVPFPFNVPSKKKDVFQQEHLYIEEHVMPPLPEKKKESTENDERGYVEYDLF